MKPKRFDLSLTGSRLYCEITWPAREFPIEVEMTNSLYQGFIINLEWAIRSNSYSSAQIKRCFVCKRMGVLNKKWRNYSHFCLLKTEVSAVSISDYDQIGWVPVLKEQFIGWGCRKNTHFTEWVTVLCLEKRDSAALRTNFFIARAPIKLYWYIFVWRVRSPYTDLRNIFLIMFQLLSLLRAVFVCYLKLSMS